jgi:putative membrane protein
VSRPGRQAKAAPVERQIELDDVRDGLLRRAMEADRLLLAVMQCSLSLIGFGFTIYQIFSDAAARTGLARPSPMARLVGLTLLILGLILLSGGLWGRLTIKQDLDGRWIRLGPEAGDIAHSPVANSPVMVVGGLLLLVAALALAAILLHVTDVAPFAARR